MSYYHCEDYSEGYENGLEDGLRITRRFDRASFWLGVAIGSVAVVTAIFLTNLFI